MSRTISRCVRIQSVQVRSEPAEIVIDIFGGTGNTVATVAYPYSALALAFAVRWREEGTDLDYFTDDGRPSLRAHVHEPVFRSRYDSEAVRYLGGRRQGQVTALGADLNVRWPLTAPLPRRKPAA